MPSSSIASLRATCPLTQSGVFGILPIHNVRYCKGKVGCLYQHFQFFHHIKPPSAHKLCKAILHGRNPMTTILFRPDELLCNNSFRLICPFREDKGNPFNCQPKSIPKSPCSTITSRVDMSRHLRLVHHVSSNAALKIVAELRRCAKIGNHSGTLPINPNLFDENENIIVMSQKR
jgi:hypothetical protein